MAKNFIKTDQNTTVEITEGDSEWVLQKGVVLSGAPGLQNLNFDDVTFVIDGKINADGDNAIRSAGNVSGEVTDNVVVKISTSGRIYSAEDYGIEIEGAGAKVENAGVIDSWSSGIDHYSGDISIRNTGKIISREDDALALTSTWFLIQNNGLIATKAENDYALQGTVTDNGKLINGANGVIEGSIYLGGSAGEITIINKGTITGDGNVPAEAMVLGDADDHLVNRGTITGNLFLDDGDDIADLRRGELVNGYISGGNGDDTYLVDNAGVLIRELDNSGYDTIKTTVSFALSNDEDIEILQAVGKKNLSLTGNDKDNALIGNAANNKLYGDGGIDVLWGNGGNDQLTGGHKTDLFYFRAKSGVDTITDFEINLDEIRLIEISGIDDFNDLIGRMVTTDFNNDGVDDTIIDLGQGGKIRLAGVNAAMLDADDFYIAPLMP